MAGIHFYSNRAKENIGLNFQFSRRRYVLFVLNNEIHASSFLQYNAEKVLQAICLFTGKVYK